MQWREQLNVYIECTYIRPVEQLIIDNTEESQRSIRFSSIQNAQINDGFMDSEEAQENEIEMKFHESLTKRHRCKLLPIDKITIAMASKKTMENFILNVSKRLARRQSDNEIPIILR